MSFFHEPEGFKISGNDEQIQEEVEDQEDQERRNEEIKNLLTNAFDDLENDDNSSINSSYLNNQSNLSSRHYQNVNDYYFNVKGKNEVYNGEGRKENNSFSMDPPTLSNNLDSDLTVNPELHLEQYDFETNNINPNYSCNFVTPTNRFHQDETVSHDYYKSNYTPVENNRSEIEESINIENNYDGANNGIPSNIQNYQRGDQLDVLNAVRLREIDKLTQDLRQLQKEKDETVQLLERKLTLSQIEIERLNILKNDTQKNLADANTEISDLKEKILKIQEANENLEKNKQEVIEKLSIAENTVYELEQKIHVLEDLGYGESSIKLSEERLQQMQEDHSLQMRNMQTQMDALSRELEIKNTAYNLLEKKFIELNKANKSFEIDHENTVNHCEPDSEDKENPCESNTNEYQLKIVLKKYDELSKIYNHFRQKFVSLLDLERKNSESLQNTILQKEKQLYDFRCALEYLKKENTSYSNRVKFLEQEHISNITSQSSDMLKQLTMSMTKLNEILKVCDKIEEQNFQLSEKMPINDCNQDILISINKDLVDASVEILDVQENTETAIVNKSESDSTKEIIQLKVELQEVQKELDRVKELYIDVCATKDRLALDYKNQLNNFRLKQTQTELQQERDTITQEIKMHILTNKQLFNDYIKILKSVTNIEENIKIKKNLIPQCTQTEFDEETQKELDLVVPPVSSLQPETENIIQENMLREMKKKMETKVIEELRYIKSQYEQKYKTDLQKYEKVLLALKREIKEKNEHIQQYQEAYLAEKLKIHSDMKEREEKVIKLVEAKMLSFQNQIHLKNEQIENLNKTILQIEARFEEDKSLMAKIMSEWISEIQHVVKKNSDLEKKLKESEEMNVNFCTEIQALKAKATNDFQLFKQKYELTKKAAFNYKEYATKKEEYIIHQCKRVESCYKKALGIIKQKIEALLVLHDKKNYLLNKQSLKSAR